MAPRPSHADSDTWVGLAAQDPFDTRFLAPKIVPTLEPARPALGPWLEERGRQLAYRILDVIERSLEHASFHRSARPLIAIGAVAALRAVLVPLILWTIAVAWIAASMVPEPAPPEVVLTTRVELPAFVIEAPASPLP